MSFDALPPPPTIRRFTPDGLPTQAQVEYDNRDYQARKEIEKNITENFDSIDGINGVLSVQWSIIGNIDGVTGGLTFTGIKKADGTGPVFDLEINSNVTINGNLLVNGTVVTNKIADAAINTDKLSLNSVSFTGGASSSGSSSTVNLVGIPGAVVMIVGTYDGTTSASGGTISISVNGTVVASGVIPGVSLTTMGLAAGINPLYAAGASGGASIYPIISYAPTTSSFVYPRTIHTNYVVPPGVTTLAITCSTNVGGPTSVLAWELQR